MKFSENWLRELVDPRVSRDELVARLTMAGLEVESVQPLGDGLADIVIGEIRACEKHPGADKLRVCDVDVGRGEALRIVCGAPNARVGLRAPVALVGATLPDGTKIARATLRGVESSGMLCSGRELGLGDDADGLLELAADAPVGKTLAEHLALPDATLELKLTPNRPDCLGLEGLASEVATLFDVQRRSPDSAPVAPATSVARAVSLAAPERCPRFCARAVTGIDPRARTPLWMVERLRRSGLRPISAVVDCTNYVMLELGQPMHAFDLGKLGHEIVVRAAREGETLKLLDGRDVVLDEQFLVVADERGAVALGGIMGGHATRVTDATTDVFLEAAHWQPAAIMGRARRLGMHTDASHRFERGVDPELPRRAVERMTRLLLDIAGGQPGPLVEAVEHAHLPRRAPVALRAQRLRRVLGMDVPAPEVEQILRGLDMVVARSADGWIATPPSRRFDIAIEEDLIEEVVRVHGYDRVPTRAPSGIIALAAETETRVPRAQLAQALVERGYAEAVSFAFVAQELLQRWQLDQRTVALANPLSAELGVMRPSLLPGLVEALKYNLARQNDRVRLFEIGNTFASGADAPLQTLRIAGVACGSSAPEQWGQARRALDFHDLKGEVESLLGLGGTRGAFTFAAACEPWLHPGRTAAVSRDGRRIGVVGALDPRIARTLDLDRDVYAFELELDPVAQRPVPRARELSRFPMVRRDIALLVPRKVPFAVLEATLRQAVGERLRDLVLFDEFCGKDLPSDTRSLAIGLILQDDYRTLTDLDADQMVGSAVDALTRGHDARLRG